MSERHILNTTSLEGRPNTPHKYFCDHLAIATVFLNSTPGHPARDDDSNFLSSAMGKEAGERKASR